MKSAIRILQSAILALVLTSAEAARAFNGSSTVISASSAPTPTGANSRTHALWFYAPDVTTRQCLLYTGAEASLERLSIEINAGVLRANYFLSSVTGATSLSTNTWYHVAVTYDSGAAQIKLFVNGVEDGSASSVTLNTGTAFSIGSHNASTFWFSGSIAEWAGWSTEIDDSQIVQLADGFTPSLVRNNQLVFYAPLVREVIDVDSSLALTDSVPTAASAHPRTYR